MKLNIIFNIRKYLNVFYLTTYVKHILCMLHIFIKSLALGAKRMKRKEQMNYCALGIRAGV